MNLSELESVCAVDTYGNYSEAAYHIASSPSVISKHVAKVERELGIPIFERASKSSLCRPTAQGTQVLHYIHLIVDLWGSTQKKAAELKMYEQGKLTVGYIPFIGTYRENELFSAFSLAHPKILLYRKTGNTQELIRMLLGGQLDALLLPVMEAPDMPDNIYTKLQDSEIVIDKVLMNDTLTIGVSEKHPIAKYDRITQDVFPLLHNEVFLFTNNQKDSKWQTHEHLYKFLQFQGTMRIRYVDFTEPTIALRLVEEGMGILPQACITPPRIGNVKFIPVDGWKGKTLLYFLFPKSANSTPLKYLRECVENFSRSI